MSVENVINTVQAQEAAAEVAVEGESSAGHTQPKTTTKTVRSIEDLFNSTYEDSEPDTKETKPLEKEEKVIPKADKKDEKITAKPKEEKVEEEQKVEKEEEVVEEEEKKVQDEQSQLFKVKVNGIEKEVSLKELQSSYSGQQEIQRRFTEFDKAKKAWEKETAQEREFTNFVKSEYGEFKQYIDSMVSQYNQHGFVEKNPLEAVNQLLDKMGINSNIYERALFEHMLPEYAKFFQMSDVERDAYYTKKENDYLRKNEQRISERDQQVKLQTEKQRKDYELIRSAGLDSIKYEEFSNELRQAGITDITPEVVVDYVKQKPILDRIQNIANTAQLDIAQHADKIKTIHKLLTDPEMSVTDDEILDHLMPDRAALKTAQVLNKKAAPLTKKVQPQANEDKELDEMLNWFKR